MPPAVANTDANPKGNPAPGEEPQTLDGPPEEEFWDKYNRRMEFPLASVATVLLHVVVAAAIVYVLVGLMDSDEDRSGPDLKLMQVGGFDDAGEGSAGSGGQDSTDLARREELFQNLPDLAPAPLGDPKVTTPAADPLEDHGSKLKPPPSMPAVAGPKGAGKEPGKGYDDSKGSGPGGTGADSTRARGLRWVLRFRVASGKDYLDQLKSMGAEILVPLPPDDKKYLIVPNLADPTTNRVATDADQRRLAGKIQFSDNRRQMVREVLDVLSVNTPGQPKAFWAFFPKDVEDDLARKEKAYRNRRAEDIEETIFRVTIRGGSYEVVVEDQVIKR